MCSFRKDTGIEMQISLKVCLALNKLFFKVYES